MRYSVAEIEDQLITTLRTALGTGVQVKTHAGDVSFRTFQDPTLLEGFIHQAPFVYVQYQGKEMTDRDTNFLVAWHRIRFRFYVGAQSLRTGQDRQRAAYDILATLYDTIHGRWPTPSTIIEASLPRLSGDPTTQGEFNPKTPLVEAGGRDEALIVNLPQIAVYQTDYTVELMA